jgi:hypothetical protein
MDGARMGNDRGIMTITWPDAWRKILALDELTFQYPKTAPSKARKWVTIGAS